MVLIIAKPFLFCMNEFLILYHLAKCKQLSLSVSISTSILLSSIACILRSRTLWKPSYRSKGRYPGWFRSEMYAAENLQFMHSTYTYAYIHTYTYIHTRYINKFSRTVPFKVYISGCMNSYFNAYNEHHIHAYIPNYLPNPHIRSPGLVALPPLESPSLHGTCSYIQTYIYGQGRAGAMGKDKSSSSLQ